MNTLQRLSPLLICVSFWFTGHTALADALPDEPHIAVNGSHELHIVPDIVSLSLSVSEVGSDVAGARNSVEQRSSSLIKTLQKLGVAKADINSSQLQITPHYNWNNRAQVYVGTEVARVIDITLRNIEQYDAMIRAIIDADVARINNTQLQYSKEAELRGQALQAAVEDARAKAELLVKNLAQKVGKVYSINAFSGGPIVSTKFRAVSDAALMESFQPGEMGISETVQVVFYLQDL